ncbi:MAG: hypothetical protein Q8Q16_03900 [Betaproteobacteria bacterium]|nr:hypothetical protein [Betaproteobacteria bacterium]
MKGLLLTMTEPPPEMEEEFNAWYDGEHLPERLAIPGFSSARRWVDPLAPAGSGKYLATYELDKPQVLETPEYLAHVGDNFTPWSKRCLSRCVLFRRWACAQILPGDAASSPAARTLFLACGDVAAEQEAEFNRWYDTEHIPLLSAVPGVLRARRFLAPAGKPRYVALYELAGADVAGSAPWQAALATPWTKRIDTLTQDCEWILRTYVAYETEPLASSATTPHPSPLPARGERG